MSYRATLLSFLFVLLSSNAMAQDDAALNTKIEQLKQLLNEVPAAIAKKNSAAVLLGSEQDQQAMPNAVLEQGSKQLIQLLDAANSSQIKSTIAGMTWVSSANASSLPLFNAGTSGNTINICRAPFLGDRGYGKAMYPGLLTANGCMISYAGYAFTVAKYDVLSGNNPNLKWISYDTVKAQQPKQSNQGKMGPNCSKGLCSVPVMFALPQQTSVTSYQVNGASAVAGGYDNSGAVIICRASYNNKETVGKLVGTGCDISSDDKEVTVSDKFDLLYFGKEQAQTIKQPK